MPKATSTTPTPGKPTITIEMSHIDRQFRFKGVTLPDPDPKLMPKDVARRYAHQYPELLTAEPLPGVVKDGVQIIEFKENFGTKG